MTFQWTPGVKRLREVNLNLFLYPRTEFGDIKSLVQLFNAVAVCYWNLCFENYIFDSVWDVLVHAMLLQFLQEFFNEKYIIDKYLLLKSKLALKIPFFVFLFFCNFNAEQKKFVLTNSSFKKYLLLRILIRSAIQN